MSTLAKNESLESKEEPVLSGLIASPDKTDLAKVAAKGVRLASLDFYRGLIMVLLMLESTGMYEHLGELTMGSAFHPFIVQFFHHPWHGLHFWDLIQPGFMFIAGVAMAFHCISKLLMVSHGVSKQIKR